MCLISVGYYFYTPFPSTSQGADLIGQVPVHWLGYFPFVVGVIKPYISETWVCCLCFKVRILQVRACDLSCSKRPDHSTSAPLYWPCSRCAVDLSDSISRWLIRPNLIKRDPWRPLQLCGVLCIGM